MKGNAVKMFNVTPKGVVFFPLFFFLLIPHVFVVVVVFTASLRWLLVLPYSFWHFHQIMCHTTCCNVNCCVSLVSLVACGTTASNMTIITPPKMTFMGYLLITRKLFGTKLEFRHSLLHFIQIFYILHAWTTASNVTNISCPKLAFGLPADFF